MPTILTLKLFVKKLIGIKKDVEFFANVIRFKKFCLIINSQISNKFNAQIIS